MKKYNSTLDFLKGTACIFVVFMHCEFPGLTGTVVQAVSRFCVPFFFMVSGYFCFKPYWRCFLDIKTDKDKKIRRGALNIGKKIKHIATITLWASVFYFVFVLLQHLIFHNKVFTITPYQIFNWIVFNSPRVIAGQYWFLFALLYAYILYGLIIKLKLQRLAYPLAALLFVVYYVMAQGMHIAGIHIANMYYRNWLIEAYPYFMLGHFIHEYQDRITLSNRTLLIIIAVSTLLCLPERYLLGRDFGVNFCTLPQVFALFVYGVKNPTKHSGILQRLGRDCSMLVYILHPAVWHSIDGLYSLVGISSNTAMLYMKPLMVLSLSILCAMLFNYAMVLNKRRRRNTSSDIE